LPSALRTISSMTPPTIERMITSMINATRRCPKFARGPLPGPAYVGAGGGGGYVVNAELLSEDAEPVQLEHPHSCGDEEYEKKRDAGDVARTPNDERDRGEHEERPRGIRLERRDGVTVHGRLDARRRSA